MSKKVVEFKTKTAESHFLKQYVEAEKGKAGIGLVAVSDMKTAMHVVNLTDPENPYSLDKRDALWLLEIMKQHILTN